MQQKQEEQNQHWRVLSPGKVLFNYGPTTMVVMADKDGKPLTELCCEAFGVIDNALTEITASLHYLRSYPAEIPLEELSGLPRKMVETVLAVDEPTLTPMATVAGTVADAVADYLFSKGASRVMVNNGGDIALRLQPGTSVKVGLVTSLSSGQMDRAVTVHAEDGIGGIATSGLGGRSLTRGVCQGVSVFSPNAMLADALATHIANCSYIEAEGVLTTKAGNVDPNSDIKDLDIVFGVTELSGKEIKQAFKQVKEEALRQKKKGNLVAVCARIQDQLMDFQMPQD